MAEVPGVPEGFDPYQAPRLDVQGDEYGEYFVASTRGVRGDDGVEVRIEERFYVGVRQARFVVTHANLDRWVRTLGVSSARLSLLKGGATVSESDLSSIVGRDGIPSTIAESALFDSRVVDGQSSDGGRSTRVCAHFELAFSTEGYFPLSLNTCDQPPLAGR